MLLAKLCTSNFAKAVDYLVAFACYVGNMVGECHSGVESDSRVFFLIRVRCWAIVECDRGSVSMFESVAGQECGSGQWGHFESIMCEQ